MTDEAPTQDERKEALQERVNALSKLGITIDFTPPRVDMLTTQVFEERWPTREAFEDAWLDKSEEILTDVEAQVARAKLLAGKGPTQLSLIKS